MIVLNLNARLQPMHRHDLEDLIDGSLQKMDLGSVDGGGTLMDDNGELKSCDIDIDCKDKDIPKIINFLKGFPVPIGSKLILEEDNKEIPVGSLEGLGFYFSNDLEKEVYENCDINFVIDKFDQLLEEQEVLFSYCETKDFTALYYYGDSYFAIHEAISEFANTYPLCKNAKIVKITDEISNSELDINDLENGSMHIENDLIEDTENTEEKLTLEMYEEDELEEVENHIAKEFGEYSSVFHEIASLDIHVDICIINPTKERNFYTLVTMGMGAHKMNVPEDFLERQRAELCIYLPPDWKLDSDEEEWYWPIRWLKILARFPLEQDTWLGYLHTIPTGEPVADNTGLEGFILDAPNTLTEDGSICTLPNGDTVNFYSIIPLYEHEMSYKVDNGGEELLTRLEEEQDNIFLVDVNREPCIGEDEIFEGVVDSAHLHVQKVYEQELDVDPISGYNHLAVYLRWTIENDLMCEGFCEDFNDVIEMVKEKDERLDLRVFLHEEFNGRLFIYIFNDEGINFTVNYYGEDLYPQDVDSYAIKYFGGKQEEHQDEDYLFVPYDENYYQGMKTYIDKAYGEYKGSKEE